MASPWEAKVPKIHGFTVPVLCVLMLLMGCGATSHEGAETHRRLRGQT